MKKLIKKLNPLAPWFCFPWNQPQIIIVAPATLEVLSEHPSNPPPPPAAPQNPNAETQLAACIAIWGEVTATEPLHEEFLIKSFWSKITEEWLIKINEGKAVLVHVYVWVTGGGTVIFDYPDPEDLKKGLPAYFEKHWMFEGYDKSTHHRRVYRLDETCHPVFDLAVVSPEDREEMKRKQNKYAFFVDDSSIKKETNDDGSNVKNKKGARGK